MTSTTATVQGRAAPGTFLRIAHRGASGRAPENTRTAFAAALDLGVGAIELDCQLTADGVPVVIHDETLERTTSGLGPVGAKRWDDIAAHAQRRRDCPATAVTNRHRSAVALAATVRNGAGPKTDARRTDVAASGRLCSA